MLFVGFFFHFRWVFLGCDTDDARYVLCRCYRFLYINSIQIDTKYKLIYKNYQFLSCHFLTGVEILWGFRFRRCKVNLDATFLTWNIISVLLCNIDGCMLATFSNDNSMVATVHVLVIMVDMMVMMMMMMMIMMMIMMISSSSSVMMIMLEKLMIMMIMMMMIMMMMIVMMMVSHRIIQFVRAVNACSFLSHTFLLHVW